MLGRALLRLSAAVLMLGPCPEGTSLGWHLQVACGLHAAGPFLEGGEGATRVLCPGCSLTPCVVTSCPKLGGLTFLKRPVWEDSLLELGVLLAEHLGCPWAPPPS